MDKTNKILIIAIIVLLLIGMGTYFLFINKQKPKETAIPMPAKKEAIKTTPEIKVPSYVYDAESLRDPFSPLIIKRQEKKKGSTPLEGYDIEELKLTGIVKDKKGIMIALIQSPDGKFYTVRENDKIGLSGGKIKKIYSDSIEIEDFERTYTGAFSKKVKYLKLRAEEGQ